MTVRCTDIVDVEEAMTKTGPELFKELFRIYPVADPEDYFKMGQWRNDNMKADLQLLEAHRRECGAPDVPDLEDIKMPFTMPQEVAGMQAAGGFAAGRFAGMTLTQPGQGPALSPAGSVAGSAPVVEIRLIALFVAKWKLEPVTAKKALATLTPTHRRFVIQNFKTANTGVEATTELEEFIAKCEADKSWDVAGVAAANGVGAAAVAPVKAGIVTVRPPGLGAFAGKAPTLISPRPVMGGPVISAGLAGMKRPLLTPTLGANPAWQQNKRPMMVSPAGFRPAMVRPPIRPGQQAWGW